jgi:hypothetical protein
MAVRDVLQVHRHASADVALLITERVQADPVQPLSGRLRTLAPGLDVTILGFPADIFGADPDRPVPRVLRTHVQRVMEHNSHLGFTYDAAELATPCPPGVSGAPVIIGNRVAGVAAESQSSTTVLESVETVLRDETPMRTVYQRVIEFGIVVELYPLREWIRGFF